MMWTSCSEPLKMKSQRLPFGDEFEPGPVQVVGFEAAFGREGFQ
jgi:hypothetical protein